MSGVSERLQSGVMRLPTVSVQQPWAWAIAIGLKAVENRTWRPPAWALGQLVAIHAGKQADPGGLFAMECQIGRRFVREPDDVYSNARGAVIAVGILEGVVTSAVELEDPQDREWFVGPYGWVLREVVAIWPVGCKGRLGLFDLDAVTAQVVLQRAMDACGLTRAA